MEAMTTASNYPVPNLKIQVTRPKMRNHGVRKVKMKPWYGTDSQTQTKTLTILQSEFSDDTQEDIDNISFGALAKAQEALGKRKRGPASDPETLQELRKKPKGSKHGNDGEDGEAAERKAGKKDTRDFARPSKHAPAEMSSKKAVSRKRAAVPITKREYRDPRFEALSGPLDETKIKKNYSFLDGYRDDEMKQLKDEIRKTKEPTAKETLKRALLSMESRKKAQQAKDKQQDIIREHRAKEKELIKQGKKPFYLKKTEQKKLALIDKYSSMKGKRLDRAMERKRKKKAQRDRRHMPEARRGVDVE